VVLGVVPGVARIALRKSGKSRVVMTRHATTRLSRSPTLADRAKSSARCFVTTKKNTSIHADALRARMATPRATIYTCSRPCIRTAESERPRGENKADANRRGQSDRGSRPRPAPTF